MSEFFYENYMAWNDALTNNTKWDHIQQKDIQKTQGYEFAIKKYNFNGALSKRIFECDFNEKFEVCGPLGKGLGLRKESSGQFVAFTGGTGLLVFLDLVAYLFRKAVHEKNPDMDFIEKEEFVEF
jgi:hypothetical protein